MTEVPPVTPGVCWDRDLFITSGYTPAAQVKAQFGVNRSIQAIVWHDMEGYLAGAIATWNQGKAGAHLCVLRSGEIVRTVLLEDVAWHAGTDNDPGSGVYGRTEFWRHHNINPYSVGVELEGFYTSGYTKAQAAAVKRITDYITAEYGVLRKHTFDQVTGHHAHSELSSQRLDPGPLFDWAWIG